MTGNASLCFVVLAILAGQVFGADDATQTAAANGWKSSVYGGFSAKTGNTIERSYQYGGELAKQQEQTYRYKLKMDGKYGKTDQQITDSETEASGEMRRMFDEKLFSYGTLSALHDDLKLISYRVKVGPGFGYYFVDTDPLVADVSSGPLYVLEKTSDGNSGYLAWRIAQWFDWHITSTFRWWISTEFVVNTTDVASYTVAFKTGADCNINDHLSLVVVVEDNHESSPAKNNEVAKNNFEISTGIRYNF